MSTETQPQAANQTNSTTAQTALGAVAMAQPNTEKTAASPIPLFEGDESWKNSLPEELRSDPTVKNVKTIADGFKMLVHGQKKLGADKLAIPGKHATDEDWMEVYKKLGLPEGADKYEIKVPEGAKVNEEFFNGFKKSLHAAGVLPAQAQKLFDWYQGEVAKVTESQAKAQAQAQEASIGELKKEWGAAFEKKLQDANSGLVAILGKEAADEIANDASLGNNPKFIRLLAKIGELAAEDQEASNGTGSRPGVMTPSDAIKEANRILMDSSHPYNQRNHPNHKSAVEEVSRLFEMSKQ